MYNYLINYYSIVNTMVYILSHVGENGKKHEYASNDAD